MRYQSVVCGAVVAACFGMLLPAPWLQAAAATAADTGPTPFVVDVRLGKGGQFGGRVVDAHGSALPQTDVVLKRSGRVVSTRTNERGEFVVRGIQGGVYQVVAGQGSQMVRLWAAGSAPPAARPEVLLVSIDPVVLGQYEFGPWARLFDFMRYPLTRPLVAGGIVASAIVIPIVVNNSRSDS